MKTIWKFELKVDDFQTLEIPKGAEILTVQTQNETPCLWAMVSPDNQERESVKIRMFGTGHPIEENFEGKYLGTFQLGEYSFIFHVFKI